MDHLADPQNSDSLQLCNKLIKLLEEDMEQAARCFRGDIYQAYVKSTQTAINRVKTIRRTLRSL